MHPSAPATLFTTVTQAVPVTRVTKSPAFQFYAMDFMNGVKYYTLPERGAYISLLCEQWDAGGVSDKPQDLAKLFGCSKREAEKVWAKVGQKFERGEDGLYRNARLERTRAGQAEYREGKARAGKAGAEKRWHAHSNGMAQPSVCQSQNNSSPSPTPSSSSPSEIKPPDPPTRYPSVAAPSVLGIGPREWAQKAEKFAFFGVRLRVPHVLHDELRSKLGGVNTDARLNEWYHTVNEEADASGTPIADVFKFLRPRFESWISATVGDEELRKFREGA